MPDLPPEIDTSRPHPARVYDYLIGGTSNFAADRETAAKVLLKSPNARIAPRENRAFLGRAVRFLTGDVGVRQFLDIGAGLPTANNVHQVAQAVEPSSRIVYVDNDPLVLVHARALLTSTPEGRTSYFQADIRDPDAILTAPPVRELLDFSQPAGRPAAPRDPAPARRCRQAGGDRRDLARRPPVGQLPRRLAPDDGARQGADGGRAGGDARCRDHHAKARFRRFRRDRLQRPGPRSAWRGAGVGMAADGQPAPPVAC